MAKDPAFLFYSADFTIGTEIMTDEECGIYIRLLCHQHQHQGTISKPFFIRRTEKHPEVAKKFVEEDDGFYNAVLREHIAKRVAYSDSRRNNRSVISYDKHMINISSTYDVGMTPHMVNENGSTNTDVITNLKDKKKEKIEKIKHGDDVLLTAEEHSKLVAKLGAERAGRAIEILDNYLGSKGTKYKSHYKAILSWVIKRLEEDERKANGTAPAPGSYAARLAYRHDAKQDEKFRNLKETFDRRDRERAGLDPK